MASGGEGKPLRSLYASAFKTFGTLPGELGKQSPFVLFDMLQNLYGEEDDRPQMSGHLKMFYGQ